MDRGAWWATLLTESDTTEATKQQQLAVSYDPE